MNDREAQGEKRKQSHLCFQRGVATPNKDGVAECPQEAYEQGCLLIEQATWSKLKRQKKDTKTIATWGTGV